MVPWCRVTSFCGLSHKQENTRAASVLLVPLLIRDLVFSKALVAIIEEILHALSYAIHILTEVCLELYPVASSLVLITF